MNPLVLGCTITCSFVGIGILSWAWGLARNNGRLKSKARGQTIIAEYDIPQKLSPAELGYLFDHVFNDNELRATIISLVQKKVVKLSIGEVDDPLLSLVHTPDIAYKQFDDAEIAVLAALKNADSTGLTWQSVQGFISQIEGMQSSMESEVIQQLEDKQYVTSGTFKSISSFPKRNAVYIATTAIIAITVYAYILLEKATDFWWSNGFAELDRFVAIMVALPVLAIIWICLRLYIMWVIYLYFRGAGYPRRASGLLKQLWPDIAGYKLFLETVEYGRLDADHLTLFDPVLPYCVALGYVPDIDMLIKHTNPT